MPKIFGKKPECFGKEYQRDSDKCHHCSHLVNCSKIMKKEGERYVCPHCGRKFLYEDNLRVHLKYHCSEIERSEK